jgi:glycosyltransferase involved in cell wall biosynthesis
MTPTLATPATAFEPARPAWRAAHTLHEILRHPSPAQAVAQRFAEIETLLPTLLALNAQQASHAGKNEQAGLLTALLEHIQPEAPTTDLPFQNAEVVSQAPAHLTVISPSPEIEAIPLEALRSCGYAVQTDGATSQNADLIILHQPQADPAATQAALATHRPSLLYLDADYTRLPAQHPDFARLGLNTPERVSAYTAALVRAQVIAVPSRSLAETLRDAGHIAEVLLPAWRRTNPFWSRPAPRRSALYLGWFAATGDVNALLSLKRVLARLARELPDVIVVVIGEPNAYQALARALPEHRRLLLPPVTAAERPLTLSQIDVLLLPYQDTAFNRALSDQGLMEAGVRRLPWVASPLPAIEAWQTGGFIARDPDEWYAHLHQLCVEPNLRAELGEAGRQQAERREAERLAADWQRVIQRMLS